MNQPNYVVMTTRDLRVLQKAVEEALSTGEEQYLFIYPASPRIPFALVSKPAYDTLVAQGSQQLPSPSGGGAGAEAGKERL